MKLVDEIIEEAVDNDVRLPVILRKCLVVATQLNNDRLKTWVLGELNGYPDTQNLPEYRVLRIQAKGFLLGPFQGQMHDQPLASGALDEEHRWWATTAHLTEGVAAYEEITNDKEKGGSVRIDWPGDLVARYQRSFANDWVLNRAWQEIPLPALAALVDTVRNRLLEFALELKEEIGDTEAPFERVTTQVVDRAVTTIIYGGQNVIASSVSGNVKQVGDLNVFPGDFESLKHVLAELGLTEEHQEALREAIEADKAEDEKSGFGKRTSRWLADALAYIGKGTGKVVGGVARAALTKAINVYLGLE